MKTIIKLLAVLALVGTAFAQPSTASAGYNFRFSGDTADAYFSSFDGCIFTDVSVFATDGLNQSPPGQPGTSSYTSLWISKYDYCNDIQFLAAFGDAPLAGPDFQVTGRLESATLNATVNVYDYVSDSFFDVSVDLTWTGSGPTQRGIWNSHNFSPGCQYHSRWRGSWRSANVSGVVSDGTTNFTSEPTVYGNISSVRSGELSVGCN